MDRRAFLALSTLSAAAIPAATAAEDDPTAKWWGTVNEALKFKAVSEDGKATLEVDLVIPPEEEVTQVTDDKGEQVGHRYMGKDLPARFWPGQSLLTRFDFTWDGKRIPIADRFWNDLAGLRIQISSLDPHKLGPQLQWKAEQFLAGLWQPRLSLSAEGGTVLIEWKRPEECDGRSTIRWIVSKSGNVLRHRYEPPHEC